MIYLIIFGAFVTGIAVGIAYSLDARARAEQFEPLAETESASSSSGPVITVYNCSPPPPLRFDIEIKKMVSDWRRKKSENPAFPGTRESEFIN